MALIKPDAIFGALARMVGVTPEQLAGIVNGISNRFNAWDNEIAAFKLGASQLVARYDARLAAIEESQRDLHAKMDRLLALAGSAQQIGNEPVNGRKLHNVE